MKQPLKSILLNGSAAVLTAAAVVFTTVRFKHFGANGEAEAKVWFYDQSAHRLYPAPQTLIPPDGNNDTRVRAVVIGFQGLGNEVGELKIAYLEKYSPECKALLERAEAAHAARRPLGEMIPAANGAYFLANTQVKRPEEADWHPLGSAEAREIMEAWRDWRGPDGQRPIVSVPSG